MNNIKTGNFIKEYGGDEIYYDPKFQRRPVWDIACGNAFLASLTRGWASLSTIVLADIRKCLKLARKIGTEADVQYFKDLLNQGYGYISLDGQNRAKYLEKFLNNETTVTAKLTDADDQVIEVRNKFFKDLPPRLQDNIKISNISVVFIATGSQEELSEIFRNLNSGVPLNDQEKRHSLPTPIADEVRRLSKKYNNALKKVVREKDISRMLDDEMIAKMLMVLGVSEDHSKGLGVDDIDSFYSVGVTFYQLLDSPYNNSALTRAHKVLENWSHVIEKQKVYYGSKIVSAKMVWASLYVCAWAYDNNYLISDHVEFFEMLKAIDDRLYDQSMEEHADARKEMVKQGKDPDGISKSKYYFNWQNLPHQKTPRENRIACLTLEVQKNTHKLGLRLAPRKPSASPVKGGGLLVHV